MTNQHLRIDSCDITPLWPNNEIQIAKFQSNEPATKAFFDFHSLHIANREQILWTSLTNFTRTLMPPTRMPAYTMMGTFFLSIHTVSRLHETNHLYHTNSPAVPGHSILCKYANKSAIFWESRELSSPSGIRDCPEDLKEAISLLGIIFDVPPIFRMVTLASVSD